ncbi:hypothetical protein BV898_01359 [Hypsibius exemplaris]|uniref:Uncharacterized protein n=1 Tax=Hypsibius exemplaris TaxID=2072580 RepID=A0A1W0XBK7_HYPEX|nr:hypothetical protein BV898_01359 [Hypsibius exemplaris]
MSTGRVPPLLALTLLYLVLYTASSVRAASSDFSNVGGSFSNGGRFSGNAQVAGSSNHFSSSSSSATRTNLPNSAHFGDIGSDPFGSDDTFDTSLSSRRAGTSGSSNSNNNNNNGNPDPFGFEKGNAGPSSGFSSSSGNRGSSGNSDNGDTINNGRVTTTRRRTVSRDSDSMRDSNGFDDGSSSSSSGSRSRGTTTDRSSFNGDSSNGDHDLRPSSSRDRPECTDCRIVTMPPTTTTTKKGWLATLFGRRR